MTKAELEKVIVRSFPIYELLQIRIEGHRYPRRRICQQRLGFFDTKEHAEEAMLSTIEFQKKVHTSIPSATACSGQPIPFLRKNCNPAKGKSGRIPHLKNHLFLPVFNITISLFSNMLNTWWLRVILQYHSISHVICRHTKNGLLFHYYLDVWHAVMFNITLFLVRYQIIV